MNGIRLNKYLASCGIGSRRKCDELIKKGDVIVNGKVCTDLSTTVTFDDFVKIGNARVLPKETTTILLNKPKGLVCTKDDELKRETIYELLPPNMRHLNHVGRLDRLRRPPCDDQRWQPRSRTFSPKEEN